MGVREISKFNDLSDSSLRKRHLDQNFIPETNLAVGMGRVSVKKNKDRGQSDVAQIETIENYADTEDLELVKTWDVAESASKHDRRKHFNEMIGYVKNHPQIKHIIFSHQSRSNRNRESAREIEVLIKHYGVTLHCARDRLQLNAQSPLEDWLRWDLFNNLNEKFIKDHTRNVMDGVIKRIEVGLFPGKAPFGYRNKRLERHDKLSVFICHTEEAAYMKRAFELFATGRYSERALEIELAGLFPQVHRRPTAKRFSQLLRNPFYYGDFDYAEVRYHGNPEYHPRLISKELWEKVQEILMDPRRSRRKVTKRNHPYIGLIKCGGRILDSDGNETDEVCGCSITGEEKRKKLADGSIKKFYYWHCTSIRPCSQRNKSYMAAQDRKKINYAEEEIEVLFEEVFKPLNFSQEVCDWMQQVLLKEHEEKSQGHKQQLAALRRRFEMLDHYMNKSYEDKLNGLLDEADWKQKHDRWKDEQAQIQDQINGLTGEKDEYIQKGVQVIELVQHFESIYKNATPEKKRKLVEIVSSNHVLRNGSLEFDYRKPFDILVESGGKEKWWS